MRLQRKLLPYFDYVGARGAALRRGFPEAVIQSREITQDPNRPFAARLSDVSVADKPQFSHLPVSHERSEGTMSKIWAPSGKTNHGCALRTKT